MSLFILAFFFSVMDSATRWSGYLRRILRYKEFGHQEGGHAISRLRLVHAYATLGIPGCSELLIRQVYPQHTDVVECFWN